MRAEHSLVRARAFDHALELGVFLARGVAADEVHLLQVFLRLEEIALLGVPHAVVGPGAHVVGIGRERLLVPVLGIVVAAELAAGIADEVRDLRIVVVADGVHGGDAALVLATQDQRPGVLILLAQLLEFALVLLLLLVSSLLTLGRSLLAWRRARRILRSAA